MIASNSNIPDAKFQLANILVNYSQKAEDVKKAINLYIEAAKLGDTKSQLLLGILFEEGKHVKIDLSKSEKYFSMAASKGIAEANFRLGKLILNKKGSQRIKEAIKYLTIAGQKNHMPAAFILAQLFYDGNKINKDYNLAFYWYKKCSDSSYKDSDYKLSLMYKKGKGTTINYNKMKELLERSSKKGNPNAQLELGTQYLTGNIINKDNL